MATRLGSKVKKSHSKKPPASAEDPVTVPAEIRGPDRTGDPGEGEGDSSSDEELDTRAMVEEKLRTFWERQNEKIANMTEEDLRATPELPLARIKKIMKLDDNVKMISSEVPLLFSKAATVFIEELTLRAWLHTEEANRKTLQKSDIAKALSEDEMYDFLIDIVPREDTNSSKFRSCSSKPSSSAAFETGGAGAGECQNLFLSEDQIRACMELLRKQIAQEEKLEESWKNEADIRPEVEVQLLIQQQLLQHQVLLQYLENILENKDGDCPPSSQELQAHISQLLGAARSGFLGCPPPGEGEGIADPRKMLEQLGELERQELTSDPELEETLLPPSAPSTAQGPDPRYNLPNNFNFSNNNLFLDGASLLSPLDSSESNPANHPAFSDKAFQIPSDTPISSAYRLLDDSIEAPETQ